MSAAELNMAAGEKVQLRFFLNFCKYIIWEQRASPLRISGA